jgi:omega-6 fatty acid desaturase (delta-12 desaturase)
VVHHGYTNLKGFDMVWAPLTLQQYQALPVWRRALERCYRSGVGPWLYYFIEMWWLRMYFPNRRYMPTRRKVFILDGLLVTAVAVAWISGLIAAAGATGQSSWLLVLSGFLLPFLVWNALIGFVVYVHHTHTRIAWHADKPSWSAAQPFVSTTVHLTFKSWFGVDMDQVLHHIMQHTAHHVDMTVPLYRLKRAQAILEAKMPGNIVIQPFSWRWYFDTARRCKLYDFGSHRWTDFAGRPTTQPVIVPTS